MKNDLNAITGLIIACTGLVAAVGGMLTVVMRRTKKTQVQVNGHLSKLLEILSQADVTLPSGAKVRYDPPSSVSQNPSNSVDEQNALDYLAQLREDENASGDPPGIRS